MTFLFRNKIVYINVYITEENSLKEYTEIPLKRIYILILISSLFALSQ